MTNLELILKRFFAKYKEHMADNDALAESYKAFTSAFEDAYTAAVAGGYSGTYAEWLIAMTNSATGFSVFGADIYIQDTKPTATGDWVWIDTTGLDLIS